MDKPNRNGGIEMVHGLKIKQQSPFKQGLLLGIVTIFILMLSQAFLPSNQVGAASLSADQVTGLSTNDAQENNAPVTSDMSQKWYAGPIHTLTYQFKIPDNVKVNDGDTATVTLPAGAVFRNPQQFSLKSSNTNEDVGKFTADAKANTGQITFSNAAYWAKYDSNRGGQIQFDVTGTQNFVPSYPQDTYLAKNGWGKNESARPNGTLSQVTWQVLVNPNNHQLKNISVSDNLGNTTAQSIMNDSFKVTENDSGQTMPAKDYTLTPSASGFKLTWNGTLDKAINIMSTTKVSDDNAYSQYGSELDLPNTATINATDISKSATGTPVTTSNTKTVKLLMGNGTAHGDEPGSFKTNIAVQKNWKGVPDGVKTPDVNVKLFADGTDTGKSVTLNAANSYQSSFNGLDKFAKDGHAIQYTAQEAKVPDGYTTDPGGNPLVAPDSNGKITLTNVYQAPITTTIAVQKKWENVPDGVATPAVTIKLYADGVDTGKTVTLNNENSYQAKFANLNKFSANGQPIKYTAKEASVPSGYVTDPGGNPNVAPDSNGTITFTNKYQSCYDRYTYVRVVKDWQNVPFWKCTPNVHVTLYRNGTPYRIASLNDFNCYQTTFMYLPKYDDQGNQYKYTVAENKVPRGYKTTTPGQQQPVNNTVRLVNVYQHHSHCSWWVDFNWEFNF